MAKGEVGEDRKVGRWKDGKMEGGERWTDAMGEGEIIRVRVASGAKQNKRAATRGEEERKRGKEMPESGEGNGPLSRDVIHQKMGEKRERGKKASRIPGVPLVPIC